MDKNNFSQHINQNRITINDPFWSKYIELVRDEVIPYQYEALNDRIDGAAKSYCINNFVKAGKIAKDISNGIIPPVYPEDKWEYTDDNCDKNSFHGWVFQDSDIYKWIEAVGFSLIHNPDNELEEKADQCIDLICNAQLENGYLDTLYIINDTSKIFTNLKDKHELYCFGHMAEAAVSYYNATGKRKFLDSTCKFADLICDTFNDNNIKGYPGHEIAEMALVKLYKATGKKRYLDTADFFIRQRGSKPYYFDMERGYDRKDDSLDYFYNQAHVEPVNQDEAVGHAVRGVYLYSGMADVARELVNEKLFDACEKIWDNIENKKLYVTGGIGATVDGEAFSFNYDLPNDLAYSETCASIGLIFFARRMLEIEPNRKYADVMERALYNCVLSGMAEDGKSFFYVNPLEVLPEASHKDSRKRHIKTVRQKWFGCACCPPNLARLICSIGEYSFTENDNTVFAHLFVGGRISTRHGEITVNSSYLDNGNVSFSIKPNESFSFAIRIPKWCRNFSISKDYELIDGYAYIKIDSECDIDVCFEIKPRIVCCSNLVRANIGKACVMRGPVVYCAEEIDNGKNLQLLRLSHEKELDYDGEFIIANGFKEKINEDLYYDFDGKTKEKECQIKLIPYCKWGNRGENEMTVYLNLR